MPHLLTGLVRLCLRSQRPKIVRPALPIHLVDLQRFWIRKTAQPQPTKPAPVYSLGISDRFSKVRTSFRQLSLRHVTLPLCTNDLYLYKSMQQTYTVPLFEMQQFSYRCLRLLPQLSEYVLTGHGTAFDSMSCSKSWLSVSILNATIPVPLAILH